MALDKFESLPGIIHELQDGGLQISESSSAPSVLVLGTAEKGVAGIKKQVIRAQESESEFGREGTLIRGMYETLAGGSTNTFNLRINAKSATLLGVGTDDQNTNPTSIQTLIKDGSAADLYSVFYRTPATLGPNAVFGRLQVKNVLGVLVYDNNPGGQPIDLGEVIVSGDFDGGTDIGMSTAFVALRDIAEDATIVEGEVTGETYLATEQEVTQFTFSQAGSFYDVAGAGHALQLFNAPAVGHYFWFSVSDGAETQTDPTLTGVGHEVALLTADTSAQIATKFFAAVAVVLAAFTATNAVASQVIVTNVTTGSVTDATATGVAAAVSVTNQGVDATSLIVPLDNDANPGSIVVYIDGDEIANSAWSQTDDDEVTVDDTLLVGGAVTVDYTYDSEPLYNLLDGSDGLNPSRMEMYEALAEAYGSLESDEVDVVIPMNVYLDDKNVADGDTVVLSSNESLAVGRRYPVAGSDGDALGKLYVEEYEGEFFYFWDTDDDGVAEIFPVGVGSASATTGIDGEALSLSSFKEVNFAYQLADFCFSLSVNDNEATGVIGVRAPDSFSAKDISIWVGKEAVLDSEGNVTSNGSGLLGNKFLTGMISRDEGFFATETGWLPTSGDFDNDSTILRDRNGQKIDIGKYLSITAMYLTFFNPTDQTGFGYQSNMASYYGGFYSALPVNSAPTNKTMTGVRAPFKVSKTKLNSLAKLKYVAVKQKENRLKVSDSPTAAMNTSDFTRLTTMRIVADAINAVRAVAEPYIGESNTALARTSLETGIIRELARLQELGTLQRFRARVSATTTQVIQGDGTVELELVPAFELRKLTIITSLAKQ